MILSSSLPGPLSLLDRFQCLRPCPEPIAPIAHRAPNVRHPEDQQRITSSVQPHPGVNGQTSSCRPDQGNGGVRQ